MLIKREELEEKIEVEDTSPIQKKIIKKLVGKCKEAENNSIMVIQKINEIEREYNVIGNKIDLGIYAGLEIAKEIIREVEENGSSK